MSHKFKRAIRGLAELLKAPTRNAAPPAGWFTITDLQRLFNMRWRHNASTRAASMHARGVLERMPWRGVSPEGQPFRAFVYRPAKPYRTLDQAIEGFNVTGAEKVPKGWARPVDIADRLNLSAVAVREMARRHKIPSRYFRTIRGLSGLHQNLYFREADLLALHKRRRKP